MPRTSPYALPRSLVRNRSGSSPLMIGSEATVPITLIAYRATSTG